MELNKAKFVKNILSKNFNNNQRKCAIELNLCPSYLNKIINKNIKVGIKFLRNFKSYCIKNNIEYDDYIFLQ